MFNMRIYLAIKPDLAQNLVKFYFVWELWDCNKPSLKVNWSFTLDLIRPFFWVVIVELKLSDTIAKSTVAKLIIVIL